MGVPSADSGCGPVNSIPTALVGESEALPADFGRFDQGEVALPCERRSRVSRGANREEDETSDLEFRLD